jgi:transcriptional regulator with XRE-family HTH domain
METDHPLKTFREAQEPPLSQAALADLVDVSRPTVHRWEAGDRKIDIEKLPRVVEVTGIPARVLRPDLAELMSDPAEAAQ